MRLSVRLRLLADKVESIESVVRWKIRPRFWLLFGQFFDIRKRQHAYKLSYPYTEYIDILLHEKVHKWATLEINKSSYKEWLKYGRQAKKTKV